eukprot:scaffold8485_cov110-Isochrysis_galbana.AAC.8
MCGGEVLTGVPSDASGGAGSGAASSDGVCCMAPALSRAVPILHDAVEAFRSAHAHTLAAVSALAAALAAEREIAHRFGGPLSEAVGACGAAVEAGAEQVMGGEAEVEVEQLGVLTSALVSQARATLKQKTDPHPTPRPRHSASPRPPGHASPGSPALPRLAGAVAPDATACAPPLCAHRAAHPALESRIPQLNKPNSPETLPSRCPSCNDLLSKHPPAPAHHPFGA